jgi:carbon monoxide dehydrogenase subunit G
MADSQLEFGGAEEFRATREQVYAALTDLEAMSTSIPDLESWRQANPQTIECIVRPGFSFLRGTLKVTIVTEQSDPPNSAAMRIHSKGIGAEVVVESGFELEPLESGTRLVWRARIVQLKGLVATVSPALVRGAAETVLGRAWKNVHARLGA